MGALVTLLLGVVLLLFWLDAEIDRQNHERSLRHLADMTTLIRMA